MGPANPNLSVFTETPQMPTESKKERNKKIKERNKVRQVGNPAFPRNLESYGFPNPQNAITHKAPASVHSRGILMAPTKVMPKPSTGVLSKNNLMFTTSIPKPSRFLETLQTLAKKKTRESNCARNFENPESSKVLD